MRARLLSNARRGGWMLVEGMLAIGVGIFFLVALIGIFANCSISFAELSNYINMDLKSRNALDHMTRIFAAELHDTGVQFLSIDPGEMDTQMHADAMPDANRSLLAKPDEVAARILEIIRRTDEIQNGHRLTASMVDVLR